MWSHNAKNLMNKEWDMGKLQMILHFQKEINVIMYIIEKIIIKFQSFHLDKIFNKIWIFKVYVFVMFKMKYLINRMQCNTLSQ
jgi:hypothetical protein